MRVYLDQKLKFWLAFMGLLTLVYIQLTGGMIRRGKASLHESAKNSERNVETDSRQLVMLHRSSDFDVATTLSVGNAQSLARELDAAFFVSGESWKVDLKAALQKHPKGVILLEGAPRSSRSSIIHLYQADIKDSNQKDGKPVGIILESSQLTSLTRIFESNDAGMSASGVETLIRELGSEVRIILTKRLANAELNES